MGAPVGEITCFLERWRSGDAAALDRLLELLYAELRRTAHRERNRAGGRWAPIETTVLVHETYLRLARAEPGAISGREHFLAVAARAMRQLLVDELRRRGRQKRGDGETPVTLPENLAAGGPPLSPELFLDLDKALTELGRQRPRWLQVIECRVFAGLSDEEIGTALGVSGRTAHRDWIKARAWLQVTLGAWRGGAGAPDAA